VAKEDADKKDADEEEKKPEGEDSAAAEGGKKGLDKKTLMMIGAGALLIVAATGGGGAFYFMHAHKAEEETAVQAAPAAQDESAKPVFYPLGDLLVNLAGEGKHPNFLKVKVTLQLADEKDIPLMDAIKPRIIDNFQVYLRELRIEDLRGSAGMYRLREELLLRVTEAAQPVRVRDVLFQEMLVQ
jgi:flagellar FliL protein